MKKYKVKANFILDDAGYWWVQYGYKEKGGWVWYNDIFVNSICNGSVWHRQDLSDFQRQILIKVEEYLDSIEEIEADTVLDLEVEA